MARNKSTTRPDVVAVKMKCATRFKINGQLWTESPKAWILRDQFKVPVCLIEKSKVVGIIKQAEI